MDGSIFFNMFKFVFEYNYGTYYIIYYYNYS